MSDCNAQQRKRRYERLDLVKEVKNVLRIMVTNKRFSRRPNWPNLAVIVIMLQHALDEFESRLQRCIKMKKCDSARCAMDVYDAELNAWATEMRRLMDRLVYETKT